MKRCIIWLLLLVIVLTTGGMALASDITNATYRGVVQATNTSTATTNVAVPFTANTTSWIANGILNATATNVVAQSDTGADIPFMPGYGGNPWVLFYDSIGASSDRDVTLYMGDVSGGNIFYFPATGAVITDSATMESTADVSVSIAIAGFFDTTLTGYKILTKGTSYDVSVQSTGVIACVIGARTLTANMASGYHKLNIVVSQAGGYDKLFIDDAEVDSDTYGAPGNVANNWYIAGGGSNSAMSYMSYFSENVSGTNRCYIDWEYGATFTDSSGNNNHATPTFRTTSSDADVTAALTMFSPISTATVDSTTASSWPSILTEVPEQSATMYTENTSPGIFFAPIVETIWPYSGLPNSFFWYCFAFVFIIGAGILVYAVFATKGYSAMLIKVIVMMAVMIFWSVPGPNIYGGFVPIYFGMWSFGILVLSKSYGW